MAIVKKTKYEDKNAPHDKEHKYIVRAMTKNGLTDWSKPFIVEPINITTGIKAYDGKPSKEVSKDDIRYGNNVIVYAYPNNGKFTNTPKLEIDGKSFSMVDVKKDDPGVFYIDLATPSDKVCKKSKGFPQKVEYKITGDIDHTKCQAEDSFEVKHQVVNKIIIKSIPEPVKLPQSVIVTFAPDVEDVPFDEESLKYKLLYKKDDIEADLGENPIKLSYVDNKWQFKIEDTHDFLGSRDLPCKIIVIAGATVAGELVHGQAEITVLPLADFTLKNINPRHSTPNKLIELTITGENFSGEYDIIFDPPDEIEVNEGNKVKATKLTELKFPIKIGPTAERWRERAVRVRDSSDVIKEMRRKFEVISPGAPNISAVSPNELTQGIPVTVFIRGKNLLNTEILFEPHSGITHTIESSSETEIKVELNADVRALPGRKKLNIKNISNSKISNTKLIYVISGADPKIINVSPTEGMQGKTCNLIISGEKLSKPKIHLIPPTGLDPSKITKHNIHVDDDHKQLTVSLNIAHDADVGTWKIQVENESTGKLSNEIDFTINPNFTVTSIAPKDGFRGTSFDMKIKGTNFNSVFRKVINNPKIIFRETGLISPLIPIPAAFSKVKTNEIISILDTEIIANVSISSSAKFGYYDVNVIDGKFSPKSTKTAPDKFCVKCGEVKVKGEIKDSAGNKVNNVKVSVVDSDGMVLAPEQTFNGSYDFKILKDKFSDKDAQIIFSPDYDFVNVKETLPHKVDGSVEEINKDAELELLDFEIKVFDTVSGNEITPVGIIPATVNNVKIVLTTSSGVKFKSDGENKIQFLDSSNLSSELLNILPGDVESKDVVEIVQDTTSITKDTLLKITIKLKDTR